MNDRKQYKNNKLKITTPKWNDEFELPDGSYSISDFQDHLEYIIKKHETLTKILPINVYVNIIDNPLGYKLELQLPDLMKLFSSTKNYYWRR